MIDFPKATEEQNKILNKILEQKLKDQQARDDAFKSEEDKKEFLYLWKHFERKLTKMLEDYRDDLYPKGYHSLEVLVRIRKDDSTDMVKEQFIFDEKLKLFKHTEIS